MYLGAYQLGDRLPGAILCRGSTLLPVAPDLAPTANIYSVSAGPVAQYSLPPADRPGATGLFARAIHLDARFSVGRYAVHYSWLVSGAARASCDVFDILTGGHADGAVIALYPYHCPHAEFLVQQLDSRKLVKGRNPTV